LAIYESRNSILAEIEECIVMQVDSNDEWDVHGEIYEKSYE